MASRGMTAASNTLMGMALAFGLAGCATAEPVETATTLVDDFAAELSIETALTVLDSEYSIADLAARQTSSLEIFEPFDQADTEFTVINFGQLLLDSGFSQSDEVVTIALNDYRYTDTVANFVEEDAFLAILENGKPIPVSEGGPVRIVFDESSSYYSFLDAWNWSLSSIERSGE